MAEEKEALHQLRRQISTEGEDFLDEKLDPRIQIELEKLNKATAEINKLELQLDDARAGFRQALSESTQKLNALAKKLGACVEKARPYYDVRIKAREDHLETQKAALRYERACSMHEAAKEMVQLAEQGYMRREQPSDPAWQEMLNHATMKVNEAEKERNESEHDHMMMASNFKNSEECVQKLQRDLKRTIAKSKPYFEMKIKFNQVMEEQKVCVGRLEEDVSSSKALYSQSLHNLEAISDEIHLQRLERRKNQQLGVRSAGVGAEDPIPAPPWDSVSRIDGSVTPHNSSCSSLSVTTATVTPTDSSVSTVEGNQSGDDEQSAEMPGKYFLPPSVIHTSADKARNESYRQAIESSHVVSPSTDSLCSADYDENFDTPSLDEEYLNLPNTHSPRGRIVMRGSIKNTAGHSKKIEVDDDAVFDDRIVAPEAIHDELDELDYPSASNVNPVEQSKPVSVATSITNIVNHPLAPTYSSSHVSSDSGSSSASSKKGPKLQGLILRIDPSMDPLQRAYASCTISKTHDKTVQPLSRNPVNEVKTELRQTSSDAELRVPSASDAASCHDDNSDTESIASTGPMIDDDQIEFLTMSFASEQVTKDDNAPVMKRKAWNRMSLPPRLSYLESYVKKAAVETEIPEQDEQGESG